MNKEAQALEAVGRELQQLAKEVRALDGAPAPKASRKARAVRDRARTNDDSALPWVVGFAVGGFVLYYYFLRPAQQYDKKTDTPTAPTAPTTPGAPSLPAAPPTTATVLAQGSRGDGVQVLQRLLITAGYGKYLGNTGADGDWGSRTTDALTALTVDTSATRWQQLAQALKVSSRPKGTRVTQLTPQISLALLEKVLPGDAINGYVMIDYALQLTQGTLRLPTLSSFIRL